MIFNKHIMEQYQKRLEESVASFKKFKTIYLKNINDNFNLKNTLFPFSIDLGKQVVYYFFIENNIEKSKQYAYLAGKFVTYDILFNNSSSLQLLDNATFLLLSDNKKLINNFSRLKHSTYSEDVIQYINFTACIQAVLREDWKHLEELNSYTKVNIEKKSGWKKYQGDLMFFEAFLEKDSNKMKEAIELLISKKWHKRRYDMPLFNELISLPALAYAKLAYIKGYELDIDNPLIPKELLPIEPNSEYWDYDFMKTGEYKDV